MPYARAPAVESDGRAPQSGDRGHRRSHLQRFVPGPMRHFGTGFHSRTLTWSGTWSLVILVTAIATAILGLAGQPGPIRPVVTMFFALTCPGMSLVRLLRLEDQLAELTLGIATSVAVAGLVGGVLLYYGLWSPQGGLMILVAIALTGLVGERVVARLRIAHPSEGSAPAGSLGASSAPGGPSPSPRTLPPDVPLAPIAVADQRSTSSPDAPKNAAGDKRPALGSDPLETLPPRRPSHTANSRTAAGRSPATRTTRTKARSAPVPTAFCPYCALLLQPPPASSRRCARCRQRIIVKRVEGRAVYLTEAAVLVFEAERRRVATSGQLTRERERWLRLAAAAGAPAQHQARVAAAPLSEKVVGVARTLYLRTVDRAFSAAKRDHEWETASRVRREQATALYRVAGSPLPPPADLVALFREGVVAELRGIAEISRDAELVSASCCDVCRADDRLIFGIARELRTPRLPHEGCPRGLCRCGWDLAARDRATMRRYLRRRPRTESQAAPNEPTPTA